MFDDIKMLKSDKIKVTSDMDSFWPSSKGSKEIIKQAVKGQYL